MPFTVSHVAAILPGHRLLRRWGLFAAATIGAMVPDFGVFIPGRLPRATTHSLMALLTFCLPVGLVTWWLFQLLIKPAWCAVLPDRWRLRLRAEHPTARLLDGRAWLVGAAAILVGALTHLVWDSFTHEDGRGVRMLPFLDDYFGPELSDHPWRLYRWLQHTSSGVGLMVVVAAAWVWSRRTALPSADSPSPPAQATEEPFNVRERYLWCAAYVFIPALLLSVVLAYEWLRPNPWESIGTQVARLAVTGLRGACLSLLAVSALIRVRVRARVAGT